MGKTIEETAEVVYLACKQYPGRILSFQSDDIAAIIEGLGGAPKSKTKTKETNKEGTGSK